tara:strand:+ start:49 stop:1950 length:1902 start_codon:yes stop_codon:yes gene_type:complete
MVNSNIFLGSGASTLLVPEQDLAISNVAQNNTNANQLHFVDFGTSYPLVTNAYIGCEFEVYNDDTDALLSTHTIKSNTSNSITSATTVAAFVGTVRHRIVIKRYGAPSPSPDSANNGTGRHRLNADNWIGIAETITFPTLEQELKQMNLGLGGTRNYSYQYKGIRTASGGSLALTASNGSWLYYALGEIDLITYKAGDGAITELGTTFDQTISVTTASSTTVTMATPADITKVCMGMTVSNSAGIAGGQLITSVNYATGTITLDGAATTTATENATFVLPAANREIFTGTQDKIFVIDNTGGETSATGSIGDSANPTANAQATASELVESGPLLFRTRKGGTQILPPLNSVLQDPTKINEVDKTSMITYRIKEGNTSDLPSFTLEQSISKDPAVLTTNAGYDAAAVEAAVNQESQSFTRLARGNRVNSLTLEASEGEEVKFNIDVNSRLVDSITDIYHKGGIAPNYEARNGITINDNLFNWNAGTNSGAPFFFSSGSMEAFGQQFLKVNSISLEIQNNLQDKRYMGGHRDMKEGLAAQRAYVLSFTAIVTDDEIFRYYLNEAETVGTADVNLFKMRFDKEDNSEFIDLQFKNYFLDTANWTIPDDKGPVTIEATIKPRDLHSCTIGTDWAILG